MRSHPARLWKISVCRSVAGWGDFDGDGDEDLFITNLNHLNNFLYRNDGEGTFTRMTTADVGDLVGEGGLSGVGVWGDFDNDGDLDIFVSRIGINALYRNDGQGMFTSLGIEETGDLLLDADNSTSGTWGDYDNDGDLDLFVTNIDDAPNALYQNKCEGYFVKMTEEEVGAIAGGGGTSFGASWADYDNDGDLDLYVANATQDAGQDNFFYDNNGRRRGFHELAMDQFRMTMPNRLAPVGATTIMTAFLICMSLMRTAKTICSSAIAETAPFSKSAAGYRLSMATIRLAPAGPISITTVIWTFLSQIPITKIMIST